MDHIDWIGSIGVFQILLAYVLNVSGKLNTEKLTYKILNFLGGAMACTASVLMSYVPFIILEGVWTIVSFIALIKHRSGVSS